MQSIMAVVGSNRDDSQLFLFGKSNFWGEIQA